MGGIHGGHYRLYLLCAGGGMVAMDERLYGKNSVVPALMPTLTYRALSEVEFVH